MDFDCSKVTDGTPCTSGAGLAKFKFQSGKTRRLRLINAGAEGIQRFSIDNHTMTVKANDFVPIVPYDTNVVTLGVNITFPRHWVASSSDQYTDRPTYRRYCKSNRRANRLVLDALEYQCQLLHVQRARSFGCDLLRECQHCRQARGQQPLASR